MLSSKHFMFETFYKNYMCLPCLKWISTFRLYFDGLIVFEMFYNQVNVEKTMSGSLSIGNSKQNRKMNKDFMYQVSENVHRKKILYEYVSRIETIIIVRVQKKIGHLIFTAYWILCLEELISVIIGVSSIYLSQLAIDFQIFTNEEHYLGVTLRFHSFIYHLIGYSEVVNT